MEFFYVLPQKPGMSMKLVVPTSLQMGWIGSPPYFCTVSETGRDVAEQYIEIPVGSLAEKNCVVDGSEFRDFRTERERYSKGIIQLHAGGIHG